MENNELSGMEKINQTINYLNEISFLHEDLLSVAVDFNDTYFKDNENSRLLFDKFWAQPAFTQQSVLAVREAVVLHTAAITFDQKIPFETIIEGCVNFTAQKEHLEQLQMNPIQAKSVRNFLNSLRREVFSNLYQQTTDFGKATEISEEILTNRYKLFMTTFA